MKIYDVLILGGGASALMCAGHLKKSLHVGIVENNAKVAQKLKISGGGKCNITNVEVSSNNFDGEESLVNYALQTFSKDDLLTFLGRNGISPEIRKNRYYFCRDSSDEIINVLKHLAQHVEILLNTTVREVCKHNDLFEVKTSKGTLKTKKLVVATGGKSFKTLGATDVGLRIANDFGLSVKEFTPALVGMTVQPSQFWMKELSGLSCYVHIKVEGKLLKEEMLFAHKGMSGPCILSASLYWKKGNMAIDFLPNDTIFKLINGSKKVLSSVIPLPKRLAKALLDAIDVKDTQCKKLTKEQKEKLQAIHNYAFAPAGNFGFTKAEVSRGGVLSENLNPESLEALHVENLYFIGEVVDVTGELGGYNFQWAFSSAVVCAKDLNKEK
ncbi:aminoacetone oxidase family FAD-binding enzyme [Sulfurimonas sp. SAG-AH-194-I05]|nr:aminoacetone oxidase family FAD-binding enzyme [Sulfurimonas sp. SAG-AH-194-I05]MDF1875002.1 aminoacetone oxidase family FAD-binding enzyme [Sulfurimonas sp. SAG-AH-194-I05]